MAVKQLDDEKRFKIALAALRDGTTVAEVQAAITRTIAEYNADYPHSSLGCMSPLESPVRVRRTGREEAWRSGKVTVEWVST